MACMARPRWIILAFVNMLTPPGPRTGPITLEIEVVYDLVCPWCYLGVRRLLRALRRRSDIRTLLAWRPFLLNPDMPRGGLSRADYVLRKYGGEERARRLYASITEIGRNEAVIFRFDRIRRTPSSVDAHRLVGWATRLGQAAELVEMLFSAHFAEGLEIGDEATLIAIAGAAGLDTVAAREFLRSEADLESVHAENLRAHRLGINGVPCFVIAGRHAIAGAQEPEVIDRLLDVAVLEARELLPI